MNNNDGEILKANVVSETYKSNNNIATAEPVYSTKLYGNIDEEDRGGGGGGEVSPQGYGRASKAVSKDSGAR